MTRNQGVELELGRALRTLAGGVAIAAAMPVVAAAAPAAAPAAALASSAAVPPGRGVIDATRGDMATDFHWTGHVDARRWVRVRNLSGSIRVDRAPGADVEIRGHKRWRRGNPDDVRFAMSRTGPGDGDVLVCALWGDESRCDEHAYDSDSRHHHAHDDDVSVDFTVLLPAGVKVLAGTVNGEVQVEGVTEEVDASSVNGRVEAASSGGPVRASSVNGSVDARMGTIGAGSRLTLESVNGSVSVTLPADLRAEVDLTTTNGSVQSDFPIAVLGSLDRRHLHGTIGGAPGTAGGGTPELRIETVNGSIALRKGSA